MKKLLIVIVAAIFSSSCAPTLNTTSLTPAEQEYLNATKSMNTTFNVSPEKSEICWARAQSFIGKYSTMKIQVVSDYSISTYTPVNVGDYDHLSPKYGYSINRMPLGDKVEFQVICSTNSPGFFQQVAENNAKILAYFIKTGEKMDQFIDKKF